MYVSADCERSPKSNLLGIFTAFILAVLMWSAAGCVPTCVTDVPVSMHDQSRFNELLITAGMNGVLCQNDHYTVFAPTNQAFDRLPAGQLDAWKDLNNREKLQSMLLGHVVLGELTENDLASKGSVTTVNGKTLSLTGTTGRIFVEHSAITGPGVIAKNGIVYPVDGVLGQ